MISGDVKQAAAICRTRERRRVQIHWTTAMNQAALPHKCDPNADVVPQRYTSSISVFFLVH